MTRASRITMDQLFKDGEDFAFKNVDYSSEKVEKDIEEVTKIQEKIRKSTEVDLNELKSFIFKV